MLAFGVAYPGTMTSMILWWPVGGAKYRIRAREKFTEHLAFVEQHGLAQVVSLVAKEGKPFGTDSRGGPWATVIHRDAAFAERFAQFDTENYKSILADMARTLFDRDTAPGAEPEELFKLKIPALVAQADDIIACRIGGRVIWKSACRTRSIGMFPSRSRSKNGPRSAYSTSWKRTRWRQSSRTSARTSGACSTCRPLQTFVCGSAHHSKCCLAKCRLGRESNIIVRVAKQSKGDE